MTKLSIVLNRMGVGMVALMCFTALVQVSKFL